jgi:hypothetical protein
MKYLLFCPLALLAVGAASCGSDFSKTPSAESVVLTVQSGNLGTSAAPLPISFTDNQSFTFHVEAHRPDGSVDTSFNGFLRASVKPGTVASVTGPNTAGRNVQLVNGVADGVVVQIVASYGPSRIWFDDQGYVPADPARTNTAGMPNPPQCSDGIDNNGNGLVDFPADPGCAYANDDTENGGTLATGTSPVIYFATPRISDVRGGPGGGDATPFPFDAVDMDTGWRGGTSYAFSTIVTAITADGFMVADLQDDMANPFGYQSVYAYTYSTPPLMRVCDRLRVFGGTASDFYGYTEINYPTWELEEWDPTQRPCGVPEPVTLAAADLSTTATLFRNESSLVRVGGNSTIQMHVTQHFGPGFATKDPMTGQYVMTNDATDCDFDKNGKIAFTGGEEEKCYYACNGGALPDGTMLPNDIECTEYSGYASQANFNVVLTDSSGAMPQSLKVNVNGSADPVFDPLVLRGKPVYAWTGNLRYFSGGSQWTINARCADDIITDPNGTPLSSEKACVHARTITNNNEGSQ